jgi:hypothetical protein
MSIESNYISISGWRERVERSADEVLERKESFIEDLGELGLPKLDQTELSHLFDQKIVKTLKYKNLSTEITHLNQWDASCVGFEKPPFFICENDKEEREDWLPRIEMIQQMVAELGIFSLSIIPMDPDVKQTWFCKKVLRREQPVRITTEMLAHFNMKLEDIPEVPSYPDYQSSSTNTEESNESMDLYNPPQTLKGFFAPFSGFSSKLARSEFDPEVLPPEVKQVNVLKKGEVDRAIEMIRDHSLRQSILRIVASFCEDFHAKSIGLLVLQAPRPEQFFFTKVYPLNNL